MNRKKKFDCVKMKWDIQQKILKEMKGVPPEKQRAMMIERIQSDPILGPVWRKARRKTPIGAKSGSKS